jgi:predicted nucleotidyltransferase
MKSDYNSFSELGLEIFGIFLYGSQNYGLEHENSDIDVKLIYFPEKSDEKGKVEAEVKAYIREDVADGKVVLATYNEFLDGLKTSHPTCLEILYTDYYIINHKYTNIWEYLLTNREIIAHSNEKSAIKELLRHLMELIVSDYTFFFDTKVSNKKLALFYRFQALAKDYLQGIPYKDCLNVPNKQTKAFLRFLREEQPLELQECLQQGKEIITNLLELIDSLEEKEFDYSIFEPIEHLFLEAARND